MIKQLLLPFERRKPKMVQMTFRFKKGVTMKVNAVKFFRSNNPKPIPQPKPSTKQRVDLAKQGKKIDLFM